jgi:hypothetical protein
MKLLITSIKPNPTGKDRNRNGGASATQLAAEWVDFRNDNGQAVNLSGLSLWHKAYSGSNWEWQKITTFTAGTLAAGQIMRVHSGQARQGVISAEDMAGAHQHTFTGPDAYVWNNREGDTPALFVQATKETIDTASYDPNPAEGAILVRQGDKLVGRAKAAGW